MHEFVLSARNCASRGVHAIDIAKALIDRGIYSPTVYFPLTVKEAIMIEPTETETKETLDEFVRVMKEMARLAEESPESFRDMPQSLPVGRLDEVKAARDRNLASLPDRLD